MSIFDRFIDCCPALRCSRAEAVARITKKAFVKDASFGDSPMQINYEFPDSRGQVVAGKYVGTESSFHGVKVGDQIVVRYLESDAGKNAPKDALGIITAIPGNE